MRSFTLLFLCTQIAFSTALAQLPATFAGVAGPKVPRNIDMSQRLGNEAETSVAVSHTNPLLITTVSNLESNALFHSWSTDGGHTWQNNVIANGDALGFACCDAQLASDDFGNIFLTYLSSSIAVKMAISTDGGATFQPLPFLTSLPIGIPTFPLQESRRARPNSQWRPAVDCNRTPTVCGFRGQRPTVPSRQAARP